MTYSIRSLSSFEEFYSEWHPRAIRLARKRGLRDPEAVAGDIMLVFLEKDYLDRYDPTRSGATSFSAWVNHVIYARLNNAYRNESRRPQTLEILEHDGLEEDQPVAEFKMLAMSCFELLRERYGMELAEVWVSIVKQVVEDSTARTGRARQWLITKHLDLGATAVSARMAELRRTILNDADLKEMLGADRWAHSAA